MEWHCPGCKLAFETDSGKVIVPVHKTRRGSECPWSGRPHKLTPPTTGAPEAVRARREKQEAKRAEERKRMLAEAAKKPQKAPPQPRQEKAPREEEMT